MHSFSEIIDSSLTTATALCWQWDVMPEFGSLVSIDNQDGLIIGLVAGIQTGSSDPSRVPFAYKKTIEELKKEQPQIFMFLQTTLTIQLIGWVDKKTSKLCYRLPSKPPLIHSFVSELPFELATSFLSQPDFLHLLKFFDESTLDEALLTLLHRSYLDKKISMSEVQALVTQYARHVGSDFKRFRSFCSRLEGLIQ